MFLDYFCAEVAKFVLQIFWLLLADYEFDSLIKRILINSNTILLQDSLLGHFKEYSSAIGSFVWFVGLSPLRTRAFALSMLDLSVPAALCPGRRGEL